MGRHQGILFYENIRTEFVVWENSLCNNNNSLFPEISRNIRISDENSKESSIKLNCSELRAWLTQITNTSHSTSLWAQILIKLPPQFIYSLLLNRWKKMLKKKINKLRHLTIWFACKIHQIVCIRFSNKQQNVENYLHFNSNQLLQTRGSFGIEFSNCFVSQKKLFWAK